MLPRRNTSSVTDVPAKQPGRCLPSLTTDELDYHLPERLIATSPAQPRDAARMLVVHRSSDLIEHRHIRDLPAYLNPGDALVFNTTAVTPARLIGQRADTAGKVEGLFLSFHPDHTWQVMLKSNGKLRPGMRIILHDQVGRPSNYELHLLEREDETWRVRLNPYSSDHAEVLSAVGRTPLPPYILRARGEHAIADALDRAWYQTVYASASVEDRRSIAAPTAGLHFTEDLLQALHQRGVQRLDVLLHVGAGTFKPVTAPTLAEHAMHSEAYEVPAETIEALSRIKRSRSGRVIAVGTTTVRTLESLPRPLPHVDPGQSLRSDTDLLIAPPYEFAYVDGMLTNFHLPRSTLLALVGAMVGLDRLKNIYAQAIAMQYRFYSYGDAMLIV